MTAPEDVHEWISFEDPDEHRTWVFDATYLRSNYHCIYGCGCKGILEEEAPEAMLGCCSFGAHFVDDEDVAALQRTVERLEPHQMQYYRKARKSGYLRDGEPGDDGTPSTVTRLVDDACIFLNRVGFEGGVGCSLHIAALGAGEHPNDWKPQVCWQVPIRLEHSADESGHVTSRVREWKRRDWGEGGEDFAWWCTESSEAFSNDAPLYQSARDDLIGLVGEPIYEMMVALLERPGWTPLPHPVRRRADADLH